MKFLKGLALSLLSSLLFLSLTIFGLTFMLNKTLLDPDFVIAELNRLDVPSLVGELFSIEAPQEIPYLTEVIDETITELEPWMKEEMGTVIYSGYDYLMGRTQSLNLVISTEPVSETLRENLWEAFSASPPPELAMLPQPIVEQYFNQFYQQQFGEIIPPTIEFTESSLPPDTLATLEQVRQAIGYLPLVYQGLIGFMVLLVLGIVLIHHEVRGATRQLGTTFVFYGAFEYAGILAAKYFADKPLPMPGLPSSLQTWMPQFFYNLLAPLEMFSLGLLIGGVVLLIVSFVYPRLRPSQPPPEAVPPSPEE